LLRLDRQIQPPGDGFDNPSRAYTGTKLFLPQDIEKIREIFEWRTFSGDKIAIGDVTVTPQSQALIVRWPGGGFVWNRPAAILVERDEGTERIPIVDVTRLAQWGLLGLSLVFFHVLHAEQNAQGQQ